MQQQYPKRLIEVDLPIKRVSAHSRDEKDSRCGHIPRLHIYPAARPLAACRAVICATLWFDPADEKCPASFRRVAKCEMLKWAQDNRGLLGLESYEHFEAVRKEPGILDDNEMLRTLLLDFIADFANWDNSTRREYLETSRALTDAAHVAAGGEPGTKPLVVDPFAGGGAIPLETLRIGADAFASDSNPLALLINKTVIQYAPRFGQELAEAVLRWGKEVNGAVSKVLAPYFPDEPDGKTPIAYLWARTVLSEAPDSHDQPVEIPLIRSMWLSRKGELVALRWNRSSSGQVRTEPVQIKYANGRTLNVRRPILEIFKPKSPSEVGKGTVARNSATCPVTGHTTPAPRVQIQLKERNGGAADARLYCVVSIKQGKTGRHYSLPGEQQVTAYSSARAEFDRRKNETTDGWTTFPQEPLPTMSGVFNAPLYGHSTWGSLFNARQLIALTTYVQDARKTIAVELAKNHEYGVALAAVLGLAIDRLADLNASLCVWQLSTPNTAHVFGRWALPMIMDYGEVNPLASAGGSPESAVWRIASALRDIAKVGIGTGEVTQCSAVLHPLSNDAADALITDPPYYNAIPYADISDFFYVWLRRTVGEVFPDLFEAELSSKEVEICEMAGWDPDRYPHKDKAFFEKGMTQAFQRAREYVKPSGIGLVVFAHKSTSGWEAMLQAIIDAGWTITASWPIDTEMASRLRAKNSATLTSSIHLVCRPRENADGSARKDDIGDWREVLLELPRRIHEWMPRLAEEGVVGADGIFACLGPALEVFSRYSRVEKASGDKVELREYLEQVWAAVANEALTMIFEGADATGFEEDARLTAMWLWTLFAGAANGNQTDSEPEDEGADESDDERTSAKGGKPSGFALEYDAARKIAQGLGARLETLPSLVEVKGDKARLLPVAERTKYLFGKDESEAPAKRRKKEPQGKLFEIVADAQSEVGGWGNKSAPKLGDTVLDRIHQSMILFAAGRGESLKRFLVDDGAGRDERFWRLAQALVALYPKGTDERRWIEGVMGRKKGLGF